MNCMNKHYNLKDNDFFLGLNKIGNDKTLLLSPPCLSHSSVFSPLPSPLSESSISSISIFFPLP